MFQYPIDILPFYIFLIGAVILVAGICSEPQTPTNGQKTGSDYSLGAQVTFSCSDGYSLVGSSSLNCEASGSTVNWSGNIPTCQGTSDL